ncbi:poly-beta-1,6-N-acetyl-D-glucosamine biosynthesis protein PgaD [Nautilia sp. PV-1]|uniref:poly-beta-1,6-N-acetyl-D-glucosamine biosynthesis protein PgaD n=1 Tax=Nautilia sp. PV-1 TaxID=2579250 RepID=UPI000FDA7467|nr:poly-beta-1,6-N-acetyl-D-glucosamine biosynthesis protein PgaD [Nautilia sp. PV-1]AZV47433.1 poly-beta-1,6-N-acetyl-D-glucosamine biosynthesis protein PgaD [Nautilia sp. PV-1]
MLNTDKIIIENPEFLNKTAKARDKIITFLFWAFLIYIFRPLFALILWLLFEIHVFSEDVFNMDVYEEIVKFLIKNSFTIFAFGVIFISWALYNKITYGNLHRRKPIPEVTDEEIAEYFKINIADLKKWKNSRYIKFDIEETDRGISIKEYKKRN